MPAKSALRGSASHYGFLVITGRARAARHPAPRPFRGLGRGIGVDGGTPFTVTLS